LNDLETLWLAVSSAENAEKRYCALLKVTVALVAQEDYDSAILVSQRAAGIFPDRMEPFLIVAEVYRCGGFGRAALKTLFDALERGAGSGPRLEARRLCALLFAEFGWHREAAQVAVESLDYFPDDEILTSVFKESSRSSCLKS